MMALLDSVGVCIYLMCSFFFLSAKRKSCFDISRPPQQLVSVWWRKHHREQPREIIVFMLNFCPGKYPFLLSVLSKFSTNEENHDCGSTRSSDAFLSVAVRPPSCVQNRSGQVHAGKPQLPKEWHTVSFVAVHRVTLFALETPPSGWAGRNEKVRSLCWTLAHLLPLKSFLHTNTQNGKVPWLSR